jgi:predicted nucleic acid-binding protein
VRLVLDSSVTLAWVLGEDASPALGQVFDEIADHGALVPSLWRLEVANALSMAVRRNRVGAAYRDEVLADLSMLPITVDARTDAEAWQATLRLADRFRLTLYDAAYLELAQRQNMPLATLDNELREAAGALGVPLLGR